MQADALVRVRSSLQGIDVTRLVAFTKKLGEIGTFNKMMAATLMQDFIIAMDVTNVMYRNALRCDSDASNALSVAKSIAFFDRASEFLKDKGHKDSAEARKWYVDQDPDVVAAKEIKSQTEALVAFLKTKLIEFRMGHDDVKKIAYAEQHQTDFEGV